MEIVTFFETSDDETLVTYFDEKTCTLFLEGSLHEGKTPEAAAFYLKITRWFDTFQNPENLSVTFNFETIEDSTALVWVLNLLARLERYAATVAVRWYYQDYQNTGELLEELQSYTDLLRLKINFIKQNGLRDLPALLAEFNTKVANSGLYFRVVEIGKRVLIEGSQNPHFRYRDVEIYFEDVLWTALKPSQIFEDEQEILWLMPENRGFVGVPDDLPITPQARLFRWNIGGNAYVLCRDMAVCWYR